MNKAEALHIAMTAIMREILREDAPGATGPGPGFAPEPPIDPGPTPNFDFDESTCEHGGLVIERAACPIHGPEAMGPPPTAEELDDIARETHAEANPLLARAQRAAELKRRREAQAREYPDERSPLSGLGPPDPDNPPLVV